MEKVIVKDLANLSYKIATIKENELIDNLIFKLPILNCLTPTIYTMAKHDLEFNWLISYTGDRLFIYGKKNEPKLILKITRPTLEIVCDYLNKFESMSQEQFKNTYS